VAGTSSGAIFANVLGCRLGDRLLAVAPVAGSTPETDDCAGTPASLVVHGVDDPHVTFDSGQAARDFYAARNGCSADTEPPLATIHREIRAKRDSDPTVEATACVDYTACRAAPVR
jgi:poly(3-hydroxybutyrate) depolymerase